MGGEPKSAKPLLPEIDVDIDFDGEDDAEDAESGTVPRETVKPAFDVERYAEDTIGRERLPTITDEVATEEARIASVLMDSNPPKTGPQTSEAPDISVKYSEVDALSSNEQLALLRARLAPMTRVPALTRIITELGAVIEDPKTAYILGFVDGLLPLETIVEVAGLPEIDTLRILDRAIDQYVMTFSKPVDHQLERGNEQAAHEHERDQRGSSQMVPPPHPAEDE